jgi:hypothetical protein
MQGQVVLKGRDVSLNEFAVFDPLNFVDEILIRQMMNLNLAPVSQSNAGGSKWIETPLETIPGATPPEEGDMVKALNCKTQFDEFFILTHRGPPQ